MLNRVDELLGFRLSKWLSGTRFCQRLWIKHNVMPRMTKCVSSEVFPDRLSGELIKIGVFIRVMFRIGRAVRQSIILVSFLRIRIGSDLSKRNCQIQRTHFQIDNSHSEMYNILSLTHLIHP